MHKQMYGVLKVGGRSSNGRLFSSNSEHFFDGASSWSLLQAFCVPSRMATSPHYELQVNRGWSPYHELQSQPPDKTRNNTHIVLEYRHHTKVLE